MTKKKENKLTGNFLHYIVYLKNIIENDISKTHFTEISSLFNTLISRYSKDPYTNSSLMQNNNITSDKRLHILKKQIADLSINNLIVLSNLIFEHPPEKNQGGYYVKFIETINRNLQSKFLSLLSTYSKNVEQIVARTPTDFFAFQLMVDFIKELADNLTVEGLNENIDDRLKFSITSFCSTIANFNTSGIKYTFEDLQKHQENFWQSGWQARIKHENKIDSINSERLKNIELYD
jgi:hypothetical protein